jgi:hypothetical protein
MAENDDDDYRTTLAEQIFGRAAANPEGNPPEPHEPTLPPLPLRVPKLVKCPRWTL